MNDALQTGTKSAAGTARANDILVVAAWCGLVTGLLEGIARTALQALGGVSWDMLLAATSVKVIWIAPFFYVVLFSLGGAVLALIGRFAPRLPMATIAVFLFGLVCFTVLLSSSGRLNLLGVGTLSLGLAVVLVRWFHAHKNSALVFWKRSMVWAVAASMLAFACVEIGIRLRESRATSALPPAAASSPNVLLIVVDTLRADHLSLYGYPRKTSPNLEQIVQQAVFFRNAVATAPWTLPSHASMLTGLYPSENGAEKFGLAERNVTLAEVLQARGYRTGAFSANTAIFSHSFGFDQGFIRFEDSYHTLHDMIIHTLLGKKIQKYGIRHLGIEDVAGRQHAEDINRSLLRWLDGNNDHPFFAFLNYFDVHDPYLPPQPYRGRFSKNPNPGGVFNAGLGRDGHDVSTPEILEGEIAAYDGGIAYVDDQIKALVDELDKRGVGQNTILIITSDHGEMFGEHNDFGHGHSMWAPLLYVPLIIRWPGKIPAGIRLEMPVSLASLPATVMSLVTAGDSQPFLGPSLVPFWTDASPPATWPDPWSELAACPENERPFFPCFTGALKTIVTSDWYFIYHEKQAPQLYDAKADRAQLHNLAETPQGKIVAAEFLVRVNGNLRRTESVLNLLPTKKNDHRPHHLR